MPCPTKCGPTWPEFVAALDADQTFDPKTFKVEIDRATVIQRLKSAYGL